LQGDPAVALCAEATLEVVHKTGALLFRKGGHETWCRAGAAKQRAPVVLEAREHGRHRHGAASNPSCAGRPEQRFEALGVAHREDVEPMPVVWGVQPVDECLGKRATPTTHELFVGIPGVPVVLRVRGHRVLLLDDGQISDATRRPGVSGGASMIAPPAVGGKPW